MNKLVFLVGESGCGKTTLQNNLIKYNPNIFTNIISSTTRDIRDGEECGKDYHFVDQEAFDKLDLTQSVTFGGNSYGTELKEFQKKEPVGLFIVTSEGVYDTINALKERGIDVDYQVIFFLTSKRLLASHNVDEERIARGNIQGDFLNKYVLGEFFDIPVSVVSDSDIDYELRHNVKNIILNGI